MRECSIFQWFAGQKGDDNPGAITVQMTGDPALIHGLSTGYIHLGDLILRRWGPS
jgi:hypothetical protein